MTHAVVHPEDLGSETDSLSQVRREITRLDARLVSLLAERMDLARRAGWSKEELGSTTYDPRREAVVVRDAARHARALGLDEETVRSLFWRIVDMSRSAQGAR